MFRVRTVTIFLIGISVFFCCKSPVSEISINAQESTKKIEVYFDQKMNPELKKYIFGANRNPIIKTERLIHELEIDELDFYYLRLMSTWEVENRYGFPQEIIGTSDNPQYQHENYTKSINKIAQQGSIPVLPITYTPAILRDSTQDRTIYPTDLKKWGEIVRHYVEHIKDLGITPIFEVWNEPDLIFFYSGTIDEYCQIYETVSKIVDEVFNGKAQVGGPVLAHMNSEWLSKFLQFTKERELKLDFISYHCYDFTTFKRSIETTNVIMSRLGYQLPIYLTEYGYWVVRDSAYNKNGVASRYIGAWAWFTSAKAILSHPEIRMALRTKWTDTGVYAQHRGGGFISFDSKKRAVYNAALIYKRMDSARKTVAIDARTEIDAFCSANDKNAYLVVWSANWHKGQNISICMNGLPFNKGKVHIYRIDKDHNSYEDMNDDRFTESENAIEIESNNSQFIWNGSIPPRGVIYFELLCEKD